WSVVSEASSGPSARPLRSAQETRCFNKSPVRPLPEKLSCSFPLFFFCNGNLVDYFPSGPAASTNLMRRVSTKFENWGVAGAIFLVFLLPCLNFLMQP